MTTKTLTTTMCAWCHRPAIGVTALTDDDIRPMCGWCFMTSDLEPEDEEDFPEGCIPVCGLVHAHGPDCYLDDCEVGA